MDVKLADQHARAQLLQLARASVESKSCAFLMKPPSPQIAMTRPPSYALENLAANTDLKSARRIFP